MKSVHRAACIVGIAALIGSCDDAAVTEPVSHSATTLSVAAPRASLCAAYSAPWGDVTLDGAANIIDAQQVARFSVALSVAHLTATEFAGDVTADGLENIVDAQQIARFSVGLSASARLGTTLVVPALPASVVIGPGNPSVVVGLSLALTGVAFDALGNPLGACAPITWSSGNDATATVSPAGLATGVAPGTVTITASSDGTNGTATLTVTAPIPTIALNGGNNQSAPPGQAVPIAPSVLVTDGAGHAVSGTVVTFTAVTVGSQVANSATTASSVQVTTNALGIAQLSAFIVTTVAGQNSLTAAVPGLSGSPVTFTETTIPGSADHMAFSALPSTTAQSGVALTTQPAVRLADFYGNAITTGVSITATTTNVTGSLTNASATTNGVGIATFSNLTISGFSGSYPLQFHSPGVPDLTTAPSVTLSPGLPAQVTILSQPPATATDGVTFPAISPPVVRVTDGFNNLSGQQVVVSIQSGTGTVGGTVTQTTSASGQATFGGLKITGTIGAFRLRFTAATVGATSATIVLSVGAASAIAVNTGAGQSATVGELVAVAPSALVTDVGGNPVSGATVNFVTSPAGSQIQSATTCCNNLSVTTNSSGVAALLSWTLASSPGTNTLTMTGQFGANPVATVTANGVAFSSAPSVLDEVVGGHLRRLRPRFTN